MWCQRRPQSEGAPGRDASDDVVSEYLAEAGAGIRREHYHKEWNHQGLGNDLIAPGPAPSGAPTFVAASGWVGFLRKDNRPPPGAQEATSQV